MKTLERNSDDIVPTKKAVILRQIPDLEGPPVYRDIKHPNSIYYVEDDLRKLIKADIPKTG